LHHPGGVLNLNIAHAFTSKDCRPDWQHVDALVHEEEEEVYVDRRNAHRNRTRELPFSCVQHEFMTISHDFFGPIWNYDHFSCFLWTV
jgi:hypothetical protein